MRIAHVALYLGLWHERRYRIDNNYIDRAASDKRFRYFKRLLARIGLRHKQLVHVYSQIARIYGIKRVLRIDECRSAAALLGFCNDMERNRRFTGGLGAVYLDNSAARNSADTERVIKLQASRGYDRNAVLKRGIAELHYSALSKLLLNLSQRRLQSFVFLHINYRPFASIN